VSPNIGRSFDYPIMMYDETGSPVLGVLPTDRTHQVKVQAIYDFPFGVTFGANYFLASGLPTTREAGFIAGSGYPVMYMGRNSDSRTEMLNQLDLFAQYEIRLRDRLRLGFNANILNVFDSSTEINLYRTQLAPGNQIDVTDEQFFRGVNTQALIAEQGSIRSLLPQPIGFQQPREIRLGVRFISSCFAPAPARPAGLFLRDSARGRWYRLFQQLLQEIARLAVAGSARSRL
jgi:hypothetical protein